jgi:hypothetical protein
LARNDFGLVLEGSARTRRDALRKCGRPHAVLISDTGALSGILGQAREVADWLRRITVDTNDRVGLSVEATVVDGAAKITTSTAVGELAEGALELTLEINPFADTSSCADGLITDSTASRCAGTNASIPHAITRSRVAGGLVVETETALERASLRGVVVDASSGLLFALFGRWNVGASVEASGGRWIPNTVRVGSAGEETVETASLVANVGSVVVAAHHVACTRSGTEMLGASVNTRAGVSNSAEAVCNALDEISLGRILEVASEVANTVVEHALRTSLADKRRSDEGALLTAHETGSIPEAETEWVSSTVLLILVLDAAATNTRDVGPGGRNKAHGFRVADSGVEVAAIRFADLDGRVPHGVVERISQAVIHRGVTNFRNNDATEDTDRDVAENTTTISSAFVQRAIWAARNADTSRSIPDTRTLDLALTAEESDVAALGANIVSGVPKAAVGERRSAARVSAVGSGTASSLADTSSRNPRADSGEHVAFGILFHAAAVLDANALNGVPQAARIAVAASAVGVVHVAAADTLVVVPLAESVFRALVFGVASRARSGTLGTSPSAFGSGSAGGSRVVLEFTRKVALVESDVPRAHGVAEASTLVVQEGAVDVASEGVGVPQAARRVVAGILNLELVLALLLANNVVVSRNSAHVVGETEILDLSPDQLGILVDGVSIAVVAALLHTSVPHAVDVTVTRR